MTQEQSMPDSEEVAKPKDPLDIEPRCSEAYEQWRMKQQIAEAADELVAPQVLQTLQKNNVPTQQILMCIMGLYWPHKDIAKQFGVKKSFVRNAIYRCKKYIPDLANMRRKLVGHMARQAQLRFVDELIKKGTWSKVAKKKPEMMASIIAQLGLVADKYEGGGEGDGEFTVTTREIIRELKTTVKKPLPPAQPAEKDITEEVET